MPTTINASNTTGGAVVTGDGSGILELQSGGVTGITVNGPNVAAAGNLTTAGNVVVGGTLTATGGIPQITTALTSPVSITGNSTAGAEIRLPEDTDNGSNYVAIKAPNALAANVTFTLPIADGTNGQYIQTNGSGQLSFATIVTTQIGAIEYYPTNMTLDATWLQANGSIVSQATYPALYAQVGLTKNTPTGTWTTRSESGNFRGTLTFNAVTFANGTFLAGASGGYFYRSRFTSGYTEIASGTGSAVRAVTFGMNMFVACGDGGFFYSNDNVPSSFTYSFYGNGFNGIAFNGTNEFVAVGNSGEIRYSSNGTSWTTSVASGTTGNLRSVAYGNGTYVAVGLAGLVRTATTGSGTWTTRTGAGSNDLWGVTFANGLFVAVGSVGSIYTSPDGITWTSRTSGTSSALLCITYGNGLYAAGTDAGTVVTSPDAITWTNRSTNSARAINGIAFGNGTFTIATPSGYLSASSDVTNWYITVISAFYSIVASPTTLVLTGDNGNILSSPDGVAWTIRYNGVVGSSTAFTGVNYENNNFIVTGGNGAIRTSPDGITWTDRASGSTTTLYACAYSPIIGKYIVVGGTWVLSSTNLSTWTTETSTLGVSVENVRYLNGALYAVGSGTANIIRSTNGSTWNTISTGSANGFNDIAYSGSIFAAVNTGGNIYTSTSGDSGTWTLRSTGTSNSLQSIVYANGYFIVTGDGGSCFSSVDGITWTPITGRSAGTVVIAGPTAYYILANGPNLQTGSYYSYNITSDFALPQANATGTLGVKAMIKAL